VSVWVCLVLPITAGHMQRRVTLTVGGVWVRFEIEQKADKA